MLEVKLPAEVQSMEKAIENGPLLRSFSVNTVNPVNCRTSLSPWERLKD